jgi:hypothetical protein
MNLRHREPQTCVSAPGGRHRHSEALPGHDAAAVTSPPPVARHRSGTVGAYRAEPSFFLVGPLQRPSAGLPGLSTAFADKVDSYRDTLR